MINGDFGILYIEIITQKNGVLEYDKDYINLLI